MSQGNQVVTFRLPPELIEEMRVAIASRNERTAKAPWTWSDFVRDAIRAKLDHNARGSSLARKRRKLEHEEARLAEVANGQGGVL